jgi:hypothetical protein
MAEQIQRTRREGSIQIRPKKLSPFAKMEESQRVGFETVWSLTRLSASRRPTTRQMVAESSGKLNGPGEAAGNLSFNRRHEIVEVRDRLSRVSDS